jgi:hypothetical protein
MQAHMQMEKPKMNRKIISISAKRQLTIPQKYFESLNFSNEAECILQNGGIFIRPIRDQGIGEFAEEILSDLIAQNLEGQELLTEFKKQKRMLQLAAKDLIADVDEFAKSGDGHLSFDELFEAEG